MARTNYVIAIALIFGAAHMRLLVLCFSSSGNNRLLARVLADRLEAELAEIRDARFFRLLHMPRDLKLDRHPPIKPIRQDPAGYDHVLFISPLFGSRIAAPMKTALSSWGLGVESYSFVTFCGYDRPEQRDKVHQQLIELTGQPPAHMTALCVGDLVPESDRRKVFVVSNYRVRLPELETFKDTMDEITGWFAAKRVA